MHDVDQSRHSVHVCIHIKDMHTRKLRPALCISSSTVAMAKCLTPGTYVLRNLLLDDTTVGVGDSALEGTGDCEEGETTGPRGLLGESRGDLVVGDLSACLLGFLLRSLMLFSKAFFWMFLCTNGSSTPRAPNVFIASLRIDHGNTRCTCARRVNLSVHVCTGTRHIECCIG